MLQTLGFPSKWVAKSSTATRVSGQGFRFATFDGELATKVTHRCELELSFSIPPTFLGAAHLPASGTLLASFPVKPVSPPNSPLREVSQAEALYTDIVRQVPGWQKRAFDEFHPLVHRLLIKSLGPTCEIEELVNEVFLSLFENAHRIRSAGAVRSYVVSITMNRIRSEVRRQKRRALLHRITGTQEELARAPGSDDPKAKAALIQLSRIVQELNGNERAAFVLRSLERMPILEIADVLGVSESTAKRWARRANEHVRKRVSRNALLADYVTEKTYSGKGGGQS